MTCENCQERSSLWLAALRLIRESGAPFFTVDSLGASHTSFLFDLKPGEQKEIDLAAKGLPNDARILRLSFTSQGDGCVAQLSHGNIATPHLIGTTFHVYGKQLGEAPREAKISANIAWIRETHISEGWRYLVDAFEAMTSRKYWNVILPAHVGFEVALIPLVERTLEKYVSRERVRDFSNSGLTMSTALNVIMPLVCRISGAPKIGDEIRGYLNRLRELRNKLVHEGLPKESVTEQTAAEMLTAAMFGYEYTQFLDTRL